MIMSGLEIHNAYPTLPFKAPRVLTLGGWLGGATQWHFAAMWVLMTSGLIYVTYGFISGRFKRKLLPISLQRGRSRRKGGAFGQALARRFVDL